MYQLKITAFFAALMVCFQAYASDASASAPAGEAANAAVPSCKTELAIARFEMKVAQDGKTEADVMASPGVCGPGARVRIQHIPTVAVDSRQVDPSNALDVELSIEPVGRPGPFLVSIETKHLDVAHPVQTGQGTSMANLEARAWSGVVSLKPGEEMTLLKDGGQVATLRRVQ